MKHTNLVATELTQAGFKAETFTNNSVLVSLNNRKVNQMEVETALEQIFDEIKFQVQSTTNGVLVSF